MIGDFIEQQKTIDYTRILSRLSSACVRMESQSSSKDGAQNSDPGISPSTLRWRERWLDTSWVIITAAIPHGLITARSAPYLAGPATGFSSFLVVFPSPRGLVLWERSDEAGPLRIINH